MIRKLTAVITASVIMLASLAALPVAAAPDEVQQPSATTAKDKGGNYEEYLAAFENIAEKASDSATAEVNAEIKDTPVSVNISAPSAGLYRLGFTYMAVGEGTSDLVFGLKVDGDYPYSEATELELPRMWTLSDEKRVDGIGNEFSPEVLAYDDYATNYLIDTTGWSVDPYLVYLTAGDHSFEIIPGDGSFSLKSLTIAPAPEVEEYKAPADSGKNYKGKPIVIEGEDASLLSTYWLISRSDNSSASVHPASNTSNRINYIGGSTWKSAGEEIIWKVEVPEDGYYQVGFYYQQSVVINGNTYRMLTVDGKTPFKEAGEISFGYTTGWEDTTLSDGEGKPYLIWLEKGTHQLGLTATPGPISGVSLLLKDVVANLGDLYMQITKITGDTPDNYRDYVLFESLPEMEQAVTKGIADLQEASRQLKALGGEESSSYDSTIKAMEQVLTKMLENKYTAHRYVTDYYSKYCSLASVLNEMREMPLNIDRIVLASPDEIIDFEEAGFFRQFLFSTVKFFTSFVGDYNNISGIEAGEEHLTIWVNWGRDQAQILNFLIQSSFTEETGVPVDVKVVNATIVQAVLSGNEPDVILQQPRSEPVNLAIRGVLHDLTKFDDCDKVLSRFQDGAESPYRYKDGLYALPDTQTFFLMFYRTDIFDSLGMIPPKTWDEFISAAKLLARNNMDVWLPYTQITAVNQVNTGIGSLNLFSSLLLQNNLSLYTEDGRATTLTDTEVIKTFERWTDFYTKLKVPVTMSFDNRIRVGTCPLGIEQYTNYTTLKAAAPEIDGLWAVSEMPGTADANGNINHSTSGGGTGCCILKASENKDAAWDFLKWWTRDDIQLSYTNNLESVLGSTGRVAVSNVEAFEKMSWDNDMKQDIVKAWMNVEEIPEVPGSYYVTRSVDLSFWNVVNQNENPKDVLLKWGAEVDDEIERKWTQYENRGDIND